MTRLPIPGSDKGTWGNVLNDFLSTSHDTDGTIKAGAVTSSQLAPGSVTKADVGLANVDNTSDTNKPISTAQATALSNKVDTSDTRLTDARTPTAHNQTASTISDSTTAGRALLTAADATAQRTALSTLSTTELSATYAPVVQRASLTKWRQKYAGFRHANTGSLKILCVGDSTTGGGTLPGAFEPLYSWPSRLASLLTTSGYGTTNYGIGLPPVAPSTDTRWTLGAGWSYQAGYGFGNKCVYTATNPAGALVYADARINADKFDVYYHAIAGIGTLTLTATGGVPVVVNCGSGGPNYIGVATVTAAALATSNTLSATGAGGLTNIVAVEPWDSTIGTVRVANAGRNGSVTAEWGVDAGNIASIAAIKAYAPDLTILSLGINDAAGGTTVADFRAHMTSIIQAAQISGDVLLWVPFTTALSGEATIQTYRDVYPALAALNGCALLNMQTRFGAYDAGWFTDTTHLTYVGHVDMALAFREYLASI